MSTLRPVQLVAQGNRAENRWSGEAAFFIVWIQAWILFVILFKEVSTVLTLASQSLWHWRHYKKDLGDAHTDCVPFLFFLVLLIRAPSWLVVTVCMLKAVFNMYTHSALVVRVSVRGKTIIYLFSAVRNINPRHYTAAWQSSEYPRNCRFVVAGW